MGASTYNFKAKNDWRSRVWNELLRRTNGREKEEIILYLPGSENKDQEVATRKGVPEENLIAVERDFKTVKRLRKKGVNVIHGSMSEVISNWSDSKNVCAILADFCFGFEPEVVNTMLAISLHNTLDRCVLMCNMQRGRDPKLLRMKEIASKAPIGDFILDLCNSSSNETITRKHRGYLLYFTANMLLVDAIENLGMDTEDPMAYAMFFRKMKPVFLSYKSTGNIRMDSVLFEPPSSAGGETLRSEHKDRDVKQRISAALAIRTMRARKPKNYRESFPRA